MSAGVEGLPVNASRFGCTGLFSYLLTKATVDVPCSQVVEILGSFLWCFWGSCGSGFLFPSTGCFLLSPGVLCVHCFLGSVERFRNDQRQHELMSDRDHSSGRNGFASLSVLVSANRKSTGIDFHDSDRDHFS